MQLRQLKYFHILAKMENYTEASRKLYITQPTLSHAISELEKELGVQLFLKKGRNIYLSEYGHCFFKHVEKILAEMKIAKNELLEMTSSTKGKISLGYLYNLGFDFTPNIVSRFLNNPKSKDIKFSFAQDNSTNLIEGLKQEKFDLVISSYMENEPNINFIPIFQEELVAIVPKDHVLAKLDAVSLEEIQPYPLIAFSLESGLRRVVDENFKNAHLTPNIAFETELDVSVAGLVNINLGVAVINKIPALKNFNNIKVLTLKNISLKRFVYVANIKDIHMAPAVDLFCSFIIKYASQMQDCNSLV